MSLLESAEALAYVEQGGSAQAASAQESLRPRPFLRWAGGKTRLIPKILPYLPEKIGSYHEPFLGSGAIYFSIQERIGGTSYLSDLNDELINIWSIVRNDPEKLLFGLQAYRGRDSEEDYYLIRAASPTDPIARAARFFYLNQTAWNGLWRVNRWGVFNVPWGARPFRGISTSAIHAASDSLRNAQISHADFRTALQSVREGDLVYLDPPYLPVSDTSKFSGYTGKRFRRPDLEELSQITRELSERRVHWVMSNRDTQDVRDLFGHGEIIRFTTRRSVAAQNKRDIEPKDSPEMIVVGGAR
ncbi:MAG TPA: DNA adenine methylase [Sphingomicrobium sp.]|nr:DNA adenine methylase [Sphingomicrobium sp.]